MSQATDDNTEPRQFKSTIEEVKHGLFELEEPTSRLRSLAYAIRMMASSDEMPNGPRAALDTIADTLVTGLNELIEEHTRLFHLSHEVLHPPGSKAGECDRRQKRNLSSGQRNQDDGRSRRSGITKPVGL
jgi:hypothetical protein